MATIWVKRKSVAKTNNADEIRYTVVIDVKIDSGGIDAAQTAEDPDTALTLPNYGDAFTAGGSSNLYARCYQLDGKQLAGEDRQTYRWTAQYSTKREPPNEPSDPDNPHTKLPKWSVDEIDYTVPALLGKKDDPGAAEEAVTNINGQRYDPPPESTYSNTLIRVTWWEATLDLSRMDDFRNRVNSGAFWGLAAGRLRFNSLTGRDVFEYNQYFGEYSAEIEINNDPATAGIWMTKALETGNKVKADAEAEELSNPTFDGVETTDDVLLDEDGTQLAIDGAPVFTEWYIAERVAFADSGLPALPAHIVVT